MKKISAILLLALVGASTVFAGDINYEGKWHYATVSDSAKTRISLMSDPVFNEVTKRSTDEEAAVQDFYRRLQKKYSIEVDEFYNDIFTIGSRVYFIVVKVTTADNDPTKFAFYTKLYRVAERN